MRTILAVLLIVGLGGGAVAQSLSDPVELPPPGYAGRSFVDSRGCAYSRAVMGQNVIWVQRLDGERQPLCDEVPTLAGDKINSVVTNPVSVSLAPAPLTSAPSTMKKFTRRYPTGMRPAWKDGRLNAQRGPQTAAGDAAMYQVWSNAVPMVRIAR
jgi:hypothetical protein